jgi:DNA end-binding protein Ku
VLWEEVAHSYDLDGKQVVVTDEELASVEPRKTRTIEIEAFVDLADVDPIYFNHPYFLVPAGEAEGTRRAYRLLVEVMSKTERIALGRFVMRSKEYLAAVRVRDKALELTTMRFADEVRPAKPVPTPSKKPAKGVVDNAVAIIEELTTEWNPESYTDCYRKRLESVIAKKRKGGTVEAPEPETQPKPVPDLMAALERTLEGVRKGGSIATVREEAANGDGSDDGDLEELSREELGKRAKDAGIDGRSKMSKKELVAALKDG